MESEGAAGNDPDIRQTRYGIGAVNYSSGEMVVLIRRRKRRREVTHCELCPSVKALITATRGLFDCYNRCPWQILPIIGSDSTEITCMYLAAADDPSPIPYSARR